MVSVKISNSMNNWLKLNYSIGEGINRKIITIELPPRALLQECNFASEDYYNAFCKQNESFIDEKRVIISNNVKESTLQNASIDNAKKDKKQAISKKDKIVSSIEKAVSDDDKKLSISVKEIKKGA